MSEYTKDFINSQYTPLSLLAESKRGMVQLVTKPNGMLAVKKTIYNPDTIYPQLMPLSHPGLARIAELYHNTSETIVIEEYLGGENLQQKLDSGITFTAVQLQYWAVQLCNILCFIHSHNLIHRDIKPSNVIISVDGILKLIDFDSARVFTPGRNNDTTYLGTKGYAAPEQYGYAQTDSRSDIYSFGILFRQLFDQHLRKKELFPPAMEKILSQCTQIDPTNRYQDSNTLLRDLEAAASSVSGKRHLSSRISYSLAPRRLWLTILYAILTVLVIYSACVDKRYASLWKLYSFASMVWVILLPVGYAINILQFRTQPLIRTFRTNRQLITYGLLLLLFWFIGALIMTYADPLLKI